MPRIIIRPRAENVIQSVANFIEEKNTPGSSNKWVNEIAAFIFSHANSGASYALCSNEELARRNYSCLTFKKKWVIVFKQTKNVFEVYHIIYGPNLI
jgi:plasmid stabilization system protein ParE